MTDPNVGVPTSEGNPFPEIRGRTIRVDDAGRVSLNDIWQAADSPANKDPRQWVRLPDTKKVAEALQAHLEGNVGKSHIEENQRVIETKRGVNGGTWAHANLGIQYAGYLNPKLQVEINDVFLRFKLADPTLTANLIDRTAEKYLEWLDKRLQSTRVRKLYTGTVYTRGVRDPRDFARLTNAGYLGLFGKKAAELRQERGLPVKANLRDNFTLEELVYQTAGEMASTKRIERTDAQGVEQCEVATFRSARNLRDFLEREEQDIQASNQDRKRR